MHIEIEIHKTHMAIITLLLLTATATSTLNFKDTDINFNNPIDMNGNQIENVSNPTSAGHITTKEYVDSNSGGRKPQPKFSASQYWSGDENTGWVKLASEDVDSGIIRRASIEYDSFGSSGSFCNHNFTIKVVHDDGDELQLTREDAASFSSENFVSDSPVDRIEFWYNEQLSSTYWCDGRATWNAWYME